MRIKFGFSEDMTHEEAWAWIQEWVTIGNEAENLSDQFTALRVLDELIAEYNFRYGKNANVYVKEL